MGGEDDDEKEGRSKLLQIGEKEHLISFLRRIEDESVMVKDVG